MRKLGIVFLGFLCILLAFGQAQAIIMVDDVYDDDFNYVTHVDQDTDASTLFVEEDYNEDNLIPYQSHDGWGIVDNDIGEPVRYFDKVVTLNGAQSDWLFSFIVTNTTSYWWSDYHFEFYDEDFSTKLDITDILLDWSNTVVFEQWARVYNELHFWDPVTRHAPGQTASYNLRLDLDAIHSTVGDTFGIRQVATTVPEPGSIVLLGLGLTGLAFFSRRKTMKRP